MEVFLWVMIEDSVIAATEILMTNAAENAATHVVVKMKTAAEYGCLY